MATKIRVTIADLVKILEKERKTVNKVRANLNCLIRVLKGVEPQSKLLFMIPRDEGDGETDPCCGMCREENGRG